MLPFFSKKQIDETPLMKPHPKTDSGHTQDTLAMVRERLEEGTAILVDVREQEEWDEGHLEAAKLVPLSELQRRSEAQGVSEPFAPLLPSDKIIYCHCHLGGRVLIATSLLEKKGYDIRPLNEGYSDLLEAGFEKAD